MTSLRNDVQECFDPGEPWMERMMAMKGKITDFHQLYMLDIGENECSFDKDVKLVSNNFTNEWNKRCLVPYADADGKMTSQEATDRWYSFFEAKQTRAAMKNWDLGFHPLDEQIELWLKLFDSSIEKLAELGARTIRDGFSILIAAYDD